MAAAGLTIAKVFLVDISGLEGLLRVVSLIGLGLALAGLGWLDRRASDPSANEFCSRHRKSAQWKGWNCGHDKNGGFLKLGNAL